MTRISLFANHAIRILRRTGRHSLRSILGIVVAVSMIAGSLVAVDSSAYGLLSSSVSVDFWASPSNQNYLSIFDLTNSETSSLVAGIGLVEGVEDVSPLPFLSGITYLNENGKGYAHPFGAGSLVFLPTDPRRILDSFQIIGDAPSPGTTAVPLKVATDLGLSIGSNILCSLELRNYSYVGGNFTYVSTYVNFTLTISRIWEQDASVQGSDGFTRGTRDGSVRLLNLWDPVFIGIKDVDSISSFFSGVSDPVYPPIYYLVWIDRSKVIDLGDVSSTLDRLRHIENQIRTVFAAEDVDVHVANEWADKITAANLDLGRTKLLFIGLSVPVVALGTYFASIGIELSTVERRREIGILKSRGARDSQLVGLLLTESLVLGSVAGALGLLSGLGFSRVLSSIAGSFIANSSVSGLPSVIQLRWGTIALSVGFGMSLMFVSALGPLRKLAKINPAEAIHRYSPVTAKVDYKARWDVLALVLVGISSLVNLVPSVGLGGGASVVVQALAYVLFALGIAITPAVPFILSFSLTRIITRSSRTLYRRFSLVLRPWTKNLHAIIDANVTRNTRRASSLCIVISLGLSLSLFSSMTMESSMLHERNMLRFEIGSDIRAESVSWNRLNSSFDSSIESLRSVSSLEDVEAACIFHPTVLQGMTFSTDVAIFDPSSYLEVVDDKALSSVGLTKGDVERLEENGTALITAELARTTYLRAGDTMIVSLTFFNESSSTQSRWEFDLRVVEVVNGLPGLADRSTFVGETTLGFIPIEAMGYRVGAFVKVRPEGLESNVSSSLETLFVNAGFSLPVVRELRAELELLKDEPLYGSLAQFLYLENALIVVAMSVGVGMLVFVGNMDREYELACILSRGASKSQLRKLVVGESLTLVFIGLSVGAPVGLLAALSFSSVLNVQESAVVKYALSLDPITGLLLVAYIGFVILASLLAAVRACGIKVPEVVRLRGG